MYVDQRNRREVPPGPKIVGGDPQTVSRVLEARLNNFAMHRPLLESTGCLPEILHVAQEYHQQAERLYGARQIGWRELMAVRRAHEMLEEPQPQMLPAHLAERIHPSARQVYARPVVG